MNIKIQIIVIAITLLAMLYIINKIRIKEIELRYSLLWLFLGTGIIVFAFFPQISGWIAYFLGISKTINMLFFAGFCFMLPIIFSLSVAVSKMSNKLKKLSQELALLEKKVKDKNE
ncbi:MAG: DUF2304 domain-containing protein [Blautia sp.]|mgnify:CR=1 FL=1|jgi:hypothetical protein